MQTKQHQLIKELSHELGTQIPLIDGAAMITLSNSDEMSLEFPNDSQVFILHFVICSKTSLGVNYKQLESILALNSRLDVLRCGWLGFHNATNTLRYFMTIPVQFATTEVLLQAISGMTKIKNDTKKVLSI